MIENKKVLALALARGGSKGIPGKNIKLLAGKPLIRWVIDAAKVSQYVDRVILSTDYETIAEVGRQCGAEVPFVRPAEIAEDSTPDTPVFEHALAWLKENEGYEPDIIVHLRPTAPLLISKEIDEAIELLERHPEADSVRSIEIPPKPPFKMWRLEGEYMVPFIKEVKGDNGEIIKDAHTAPRQKLPKVYQTVADIGIMRRETVTEKGSVIGDIVLPYLLKRPTTDIDIPIDFEIAELLLKNRSVEK
jgi:CMP-N-acetylneuraminic acid synthetase